MSEFTREGLEPLSTIGNDTPRIDAIEGSLVRLSTLETGNCLVCSLARYCEALIRTRDW